MTVRGIEAARAGTWKHLAFVSIMQSPVEGAIAALVIACHQIGRSAASNALHAASIVLVSGGCTSTAIAHQSATSSLQMSELIAL